MQTITTIGLDIAKSAFQVHGVDAAGAVVIRRQLKRRSVLAFFQKLPPCLIEACASSHYWSREFQALGHTVRLMPPAALRSRSPPIKRADLGDKGVYYRAMSGLFRSADEASQFCRNLISSRFDRFAKPLRLGAMAARAHMISVRDDPFEVLAQSVD
jgi:hypothetical protein